MMSVGLTKKGMNQSTSSEWVEGKKIYTKTKLTQQGIKNYQLLMNLDVGVKLVSVDMNKGVI
jgi:serine/threonine protein kinase